MNQPVDHQKLLASFGEKFGLGGLTFDPFGVCLVQADDLVVSVEHQERQRRLLLSCVVADLPRPFGDGVASRLLELNAVSMLSGAGCVAVDRSAGSILFFDEISLVGLDLAAFETKLQAVLSNIEAWQRLLPTLAANPAPAPVADRDYFVRA